MLNLSKNEKLALEELLQKLSSKYKAEILQTLLYGSKARGDSNTDSDIDILIVLKNDELKTHQDILTLASQVSLEYDLLINPIISAPKRVERQRGFTFYKNVARDAIQLSLQQGQLNLLPDPTI